MVNLIETDVIEFGKFSNIRVCCGYCNQQLADFMYVKSSNKFWVLDLNDMDWDAKFKVQYSHIFCDCSEKIGIVFNRGFYHLFKKSIKLIY